MAKVKCKGTALKQTISMVLTAIGQIISLELPTSSSETYDSTTLDQSNAWKTKDPTGYSEPGEVSGEVFYDPALSSHMAFIALIGAPAATTFEIAYADTGSSTQSFSGTGFEFGGTVAMNDGLKGSFKITISGDPGWKTS